MSEAAEAKKAQAGIFGESLVLPSIFTYKRSISQGRALMWACDDIFGNGQAPLLVEVHEHRGTKAYDFWKKLEGNKKKADEAFEKDYESVVTPNPQKLESAFMPEAKPFLKAGFSVKYVPNALSPNVAANRDIDRLFKGFVNAYADQGGFDALAERYVVPLVTGMWMWRNNDEAVNKVIRVAVMGDDTQSFEFRPGYNCFTLGALSADDQVKAKQLAQMISQGLSGKGRGLGLNVEAVYEMGGGSMVFPSQDMVFDKDDKKPSRVLYKISHGGIHNHAGIHDQKIGAALRCIDDAHGDDDFGVCPIEPLGVVSTHQTSTRIKSQRDFYSLCRKNVVGWSRKLSAGTPLSDIANTDDLHYVIAVLVRGGVFA